MNDDSKLLEKVLSNLELDKGTARVNFIALKDGSLGFFAESKKSRESVSIEFTKEDIIKLAEYFAPQARADGEAKGKAKVISAFWRMFHNLKQVKKNDETYRYIHRDDLTLFIGKKIEEIK